MKKYRGVRYEIRMSMNNRMYTLTYYYAGKIYREESYFKKKVKAIAFSAIDFIKDREKEIT